MGHVGRERLAEDEGGVASIAVTCTCCDRVAMNSGGLT